MTSPCPYCGDPIEIHGKPGEKGTHWRCDRCDKEWSVSTRERRHCRADGDHPARNE